MDRSPTKRLHLALGLGAVVFCIYVLQAASPLRLNGDAVALLSLARSVAEGGGLVYHGTPTHYPPGYPFLVAALDRAGWARSSVFIMLNIGFVALGLAGVYYVCRKAFGLDRLGAVIVLDLSLLSYVMIKHVTLPHTDIPYFGLSFAALAVLTRVEESKGRAAAGWAMFGTGLVLVATAVRTVGIAFIPAVIWCCFSVRIIESIKQARAPDNGRRLVVTVVVLVVAGALSLAAVTRTRYFWCAVGRYTEAGGFFHCLVSIWRFKLNELGELALNIPKAKLPGALTALVPFAGCAALLVSLWGCWLRRRNFRAADVYLAAYGLILLLWPYYNARFWLPVLWLQAHRRGGAGVRPGLCVGGSGRARIQHANLPVGRAVSRVIR